MGIGNTKEYQQNLLKDYNIIQKNSSQNITYLQHIKTLEQYLLKQFNFNDKKQCQKTMDKLTQLKIKLNGNKHVVPLKDFFMNSEDQYCSTFYKIYAVFQYPQRSLDNQICQRKLLNTKFTQTQLWSILASCIVGLSHLQKYGIKHSALKSSRILLSKDGIIKVADPFIIGQQTNQDSAITKKSTQHAYLSPEQTQALQQQLITPTYNPYKSDIFTLGMIMLQAGLLQYQDQDCYRDQKSRIHWEAVKYNIDRIGQVYSEEIKNMIQFMLNRDERTRPDWIDLEQYVMKSGDEITKSMIKQQTKKLQNDVITNNKQTQYKVINNEIPPSLPNNNIGTTSYPIQNSTVFYGQTSPRVYVGSSQPTTIHQTYTNSNIPLTKYLPPEHQRSSQSNNPQMISNARPNTFTLQQNSPPTHNSLSFQNAYNTPSMFRTANSVLPPTNQQLGANIPPLRLSLIDLNRPTRNIFPTDTYVIKTKFDENLIIVVQEDQQGETNQSTKRQNLRQAVGSTIPHSTQNRAIMKKSQQKTNQNQFPNSSPYYEQQKYNYSQLTKQSDLKNYLFSQTRVSTPAQINNSSNQPLLLDRPNTNKFTTNTNNLQFVTESFKMGSRYEGYKLNGLRHGYGKFYYQDGGMYDGDWSENKMDGFGKLYYQSGKLAYEGEWKSDQFMGKGILYNETPDILDGDFNYTNFDDVEEQWIKYEGEFQDDKKNGKGTLFLSNGQRFEGNFVADNIDGPGTFYCRKGTKVNGVWKSNLKQK